METIRVTLLYSFVIFNDSENISVAAKKLGITQPALSKQLNEFEEGIGLQIFTMQGRRKVLTPLGRSLHARLKERLGNIHEVISGEKSRYQSSANSKISIVGRRGILDRMSHKIAFDGSIFFIESSSEKIIESLQKLEADIGITHIVPNSFELVAKPLFREEFQLVIPKSFLKNKPILGKDLFSQLLALPCLGYKFQDEVVASVCKFYSLDPNDLIFFRTTENYNSLKEMVTAKMGWSVIPSYIRVSTKDAWTIPIPSKILLSRQFFLLYRTEFAQVPWFKELISSLHACFQQDSK